MSLNSIMSINVKSPIRLNTPLYITDNVILIPIIMVRKNYPFNNRDDKRITNSLSMILVCIVLAPILLLGGNKSLDNEEPDLGIFGVILLISSLFSYIVVVPLFNISSFYKELLLHIIISYLLTGLLLGLFIYFCKKRNNK